MVVADGLSAVAVERHALPVLAALRARSPARWGGPVAIAVQGRVALGDEIGERLGAGLVAILIGERPGLSSPDSLGAYLTFAPRVGRTDAERNCLSNVRPEGLGYAEAARRLDWLACEALRRRLTGVALQDESGDPGLGGPPADGALPCTPPAGCYPGGASTSLTRAPRSTTSPGRGDWDVTRPLPATSPTRSTDSRARRAARAGRPSSAGTATPLAARARRRGATSSGGGVGS